MFLFVMHDYLCSVSLGVLLARFIVHFCGYFSWFLIVSDIAVFVLKRDVKLQLTN